MKNFQNSLRNKEDNKAEHQKPHGGRAQMWDVQHEEGKLKSGVFVQAIEHKKQYKHARYETVHRYETNTNDEGNEDEIPQKKDNLKSGEQTIRSGFESSQTKAIHETNRCCILPRMDACNGIDKYRLF